MKRCVVTLAALSLLMLALAACSSEADETADELGIQEGKRPVPAEKRKPPGPPNAQVVTEEDAAKQSDDGGNDDN